MSYVCYVCNYCYLLRVIFISRLDFLFHFLEQHKVSQLVQFFESINIKSRCKILLHGGFFLMFADSLFTFDAEGRWDAAVSGLCVFTGGKSGICD